MLKVRHYHLRKEERTVRNNALEIEGFKVDKNVLMCEEDVDAEEIYQDLTVCQCGMSWWCRPWVSKNISCSCRDIFRKKLHFGFIAENFLSAALAKDNSKTNCTLVFKHRNK